MPIAVTGMAFRGPGDATSVEKLWNMVSEKREAWSLVPKQKWNNEAFYHPDANRNGTVNRSPWYHSHKKILNEILSSQMSKVAIISRMTSLNLMRPSSI